MPSPRRPSPLRPKQLLDSLCSPEGTFSKPPRASTPYLKDSLPFQFQDLYGKVTFGRGPDQLNLFGFRQTDRVDLGAQGINSWQQWGAGGFFTNLPQAPRVRITGSFAYSRFQNTFESPFELRPRYSKEIGGFNGGFTFSYLFGADELAYAIEVARF